MSLSDVMSLMGPQAEGEENYQSENYEFVHRLRIQFESLYA